MQRRIRKIVTGSVQYDGAGVKLVRVLGHSTAEEWDPFLMLDAFDSRDSADYVKGFPWHPHRGIETITYLIRGHIEHGDSIGNQGAIRDGGCQWMTAGRGILHQEMPQPSERLFGIQLWLNLPKADKMCPPAYRDIREADMLRVQEQGAEVLVVSGTYDGTAARAQGEHVRMLFLDVRLDPGAQWTLQTLPEKTLFVYILEGKVAFEKSADAEDIEFIAAKRAVLFGEGGELYAKASPDGARFLLFSGRALREPIAWGGPIVMNTQAELDLAFRELREGDFIK